MSKKKQHEEEHEAHERWLVSYADFMTLLFAFFVVMYSVSRVDNRRLSQATSSLRWALHFAGTGGVGQMPIFDTTGSSTPIEFGGGGHISPRLDPKLVHERIGSRMNELVQPPQSGGVSVSLEGRIITARLTASRCFEPGAAALRPDVLPILDALAEELVPLERPVRVEAHTDDVPLLGGRFHDNWELSAARAATVASYLERAHHLPPALLTATGFGASRPLDPGDSPEARERNRRVDLVAELGEIPDASRR